MKLGYNFLDFPEMAHQNIIKNICASDKEGKHVIFRYNQAKRSRFGMGKIETLAYSAGVYPSVPIGQGRAWRWRNPSWIYEEIFLPFAIANSGIDIFYSPSLKLPLRQPCKTAVTIQDIHPLIFQDEKIKGLENNLNYAARISAAKKANRIITHSRFAKKSIADRLNISENKIAVIPLPAGKPFTPVFKEERIALAKEKYGLDSPYFIYSGGFAARNNLKELFDIFNGFLSLKSNCLLAVEGYVPENQMQMLKRRDPKNKAIFTGALNDEDLSLVYNGAVAFITASLHESFCYPALKALSCGIPVIAYNNPSFSEILENAAILIKPRDNISFIRAMRDVKENPNLRLKIRALGIQQANNFSTEKAALALFNLFEEIYEESYRPDAK